MPTLFLVEDSAVYGTALAQHLDGHSELEVVGTSTFVAGALHPILELRPDVVVTDFELPDGTGAELVEALRQHGFNPTVVIVTGHQLPAKLRQALNVEPQALLSKRPNADELADWVFQAHNSPGRTLSDPAMAAMLMPLMYPPVDAVPTPREADVLQCAGMGMQNAEIASALGLTDATVKSHLKALTRKFAASNRWDLIRKAAALGYVDLTYVDEAPRSPARVR